jgi:hypothetical protein
MKSGWIVAALLGIALAFMLIRKPPKPPDQVVVLRVDTIRAVDTVYVPKWNYKEVHLTDTVFDTVRLIIDYNTLVAYSDTILNDSTGFVLISDTLYQNRIKSRKSKINVYQRTITKQHIHEIRQRALFVGGSVSGNESQFGVDIMGGFTVRKSLYFIQYDPINKTVGIGAAWRIL